MSSNYSLKGFKCLSSLFNKIQRKSFKLHEGTGKAKIFADQIDKQAKRKLEFIKRRQELEEYETLNAIP